MVICHWFIKLLLVVFGLFTMDAAGIFGKSLFNEEDLLAVLGRIRISHFRIFPRRGGTNRDFDFLGRFQI